MIGKIAIVLEILAGGLIVIQFLLKRETHTRIDRWLLTKLRRKIAPRGRLRRSVIVIAGVLTMSVLIGITLWGFFVDLGRETVQMGNLIASKYQFGRRRVGSSCDHFRHCVDLQ